MDNALTGKGSNHICRRDSRDKMDSAARNLPYPHMTRILRQMNRGKQMNFSGAKQ